MWKHNRFEAYKRNSLETATRSLPPGTNSAAAALQMLATINEDKKRVALLCGQQCVDLWRDAAAVCELSFECPSTPGRRQICRTLHEIGVAWKQDCGADNCKRIAFIFDFYATEVHRRALTTTHQEATSFYIMATLGIVMDVPPEAMRQGQKTCVQQQYSSTSKIRKNNILRMGSQHHGTRVNLEQGPTQTKSNWKRPKHVFFDNRRDPSDPTKTVVTMVSSICGSSLNGNVY
jgi:hypothetical protein